jgi:ketosteroid isomerase-like protein
MSQDNIEIVKAAFEAWRAGDTDALGDAFDPQVIVRLTEDFPESEPLVGRDAAMRQWAEMRSIWELDGLDTDFVGVGNRVLVKFTWREMVGRGVTVLYTLRDRRIESIEAFWDHAKALEAVGLSEQDAHADS